MDTQKHPLTEAQAAVMAEIKATTEWAKALLAQPEPKPLDFDTLHRIWSTDMPTTLEYFFAPSPRSIDMPLDSSPGPRTGTHPLALDTVTLAGPQVAIDLRLHLPADAPMVDVVALITDLAERLNGYWEYHAPLSRSPGRFELHDLTLPQESRS
jgi:hypothetical protein